MLTIILFICVNLVDQSYWRVNLNEKMKNGRKIHLHVYKKLNDYPNVN